MKMREGNWTTYYVFLPVAIDYNVIEFSVSLLLCWAVISISFFFLQNTYISNFFPTLQGWAAAVQAFEC